MCVDGLEATLFLLSADKLGDLGSRGDTACTPAGIAGRSLRAAFGLLFIVQPASKMGGSG